MTLRLGNATSQVEDEALLLRRIATAFYLTMECNSPLEVNETLLAPIKSLALAASYR